MISLSGWSLAEGHAWPQVGAVVEPTVGGGLLDDAELAGMTGPFVLAAHDVRMRVDQRTDERFLSEECSVRDADGLDRRFGAAWSTLCLGVIPMFSEVATMKNLVIAVDVPSTPR